MCQFSLFCSKFPLKQQQGDVGLPGPRGPDGIPGRGLPGGKVTIHENL